MTYQPLISCLMPFYNRFPHDERLPREALMSFLKQDYDNKQLIICNDTPGQVVQCKYDNVKVLNCTERFNTLSDKLIWMINQSDGDYLCRWDDDDISLPWRLSYSMNAIGSSLQWRPENHWYLREGSNKVSMSERPGNTHNMALWHREILDAIGGYPEKRSGDEDQTFNRLIRQKLNIGFGDMLPAKDIFYIYRWAISSKHLSENSEEGNLQGCWNSIGKNAIIPAIWELKPIWFKDYVTAHHNWASQITIPKQTIMASI